MSETEKTIHCVNIPDDDPLRAFDMYLRDYFAGQALAGWSESHHRLASELPESDPFGLTQPPYVDLMAATAYRIADAMLLARKVRR